MKRNLAPETKTAGAGAVGALVTFVLLLNGWQHWFPAPPADIVAAGTAILSTAAAYVLPHTSRTPAVQPQPSLIRLPASVTSEEAANFKTDLEHALNAAAASAAQPSAVQPSATTTTGSLPK